MSLNQDVCILRQVLRSVLWPLGAADPRPGFRPTELAEHAKKIFPVSRKQQQAIAAELHHTKVSSVVLTVQVLEARNLQPDIVKDTRRDPYCILGVVPPRTQRPSPHASPNLRTKRKLSDLNEVKKTQVTKGTLHPKWNEEFELEVQDFQTEDLQLIIWDNEGRVDQENNKVNSDKGLGFKSLFKQLKHSIDLGRNADDIIGQCLVPLRDIPAGGCDRWFDLYEDRKQRNRCTGQIRLGLQLSIKQDADELDGLDREHCSMKQYYLVVQKVYSHALKTLELQGQEPLEQGLEPLVVEDVALLELNSAQPAVAVHNPPLIHELPSERRSGRRGSELVPVLRRLPERSRAALQQLLVSRQQVEQQQRQQQQRRLPPVLRHLPEQGRRTLQQFLYRRQQKAEPADCAGRGRRLGRQVSEAAAAAAGALPCPPCSPPRVESAPQLCSAQSHEVVMCEEEVCESVEVELVCERVVVDEAPVLTPLVASPSFHHADTRHFEFLQSDHAAPPHNAPLRPRRPLQGDQAAPVPLRHHRPLQRTARLVSGELVTQGELEAWHDGPLVLKALPEQSRVMLTQFSVQNHLSSVTQQLMELTVILQVMTERKRTSTISDDLLTAGVDKLSAECGMRHDEDSRYDRQQLTNIELLLFDKYATAYVALAMTRLQQSPRTIPHLFPATDTLRVDDFTDSIRIVCRLLCLKVWTCSEQARQMLAAPITQMLQDDVKMWTDKKLATVFSNVKDAVVPEIQMTTKLLQEATVKLLSLSSVAKSFAQIGIDYYKVASLSMESKLAKKAQALMQTMNSYQLRYHKFNANIRHSSMVSLELYLVLRGFVERVKANISLRDVFKITLANYQSWFETSVIFWLQTFKDECRRRMEKALEIEKDIVQVTCLVKYSNSSVDVLSCFTKITSEWRQIGFADPDIALLGVTKITDTICDGAVQYAEKIEKILEHNGYYDFIDNQLFDVTEQLCISLNNIVHVRSFLHQLPHLLDWVEVTQNMAVRHDSVAIASRTLTTLRQLTDAADADIMSRGRRLSARISAKMTVDLRLYVAELSTSSPDRTATVDPLLDYMDTNLGMFYERLESSMFPMMLEHTWDATLRVFSETLAVGKPPWYYVQMLQHLHSIEAYFNKESSSLGLTSNALYKDLLDVLDLNSLTSEQLMLEYYKGFIGSPQTPEDYYGHLGIKMGYVQETADNVTLYIKVLQGSDLPMTKQYPESDTFVTVALGPSTTFRLNRPSKTRVVYSSCKPVFQEIFQFQMIPNHFLSKDGAVVVLSVWRYVRFLPHTFIGEVLVSLGDAMRISPPQSIEDMYAIMMPLKRPDMPTKGPFQILQDRVGQDKDASELVRRRRATTGRSVTFCQPVCYLIAAFRGKLLS